MFKENEERIVLLMCKYCTRCLSTNEKKELNNWVNKNPNKRKILLDEFTRLKHVLQQLKIFDSINERQGWQKFIEKCPLKQTESGMPSVCSLMPLSFV
jgi:hypothetical protein